MSNTSSKQALHDELLALHPKNPKEEWGFGRTTKTVRKFIKSNIFNARWEEFSQQLTQAGQIDKATTEGTRRFVLNEIIPVHPDIYHSILPSISTCQEAVDKDTAIAANNEDSVFLPSCKNIRPGNSMRKWLERIAGYGPCYSFVSDLEYESIIGKAFLDEVINQEYTVDNKEYHVTLDQFPVGYYLGEKGDDKTYRREAMEEHTAKATQQDGDNMVNLCNQCNLELKVVMPGITQFLSYGEYPQNSAILNIHFKKDPNGIKEITKIEEKIATKHIPKFQKFIRKIMRHAVTTVSEKKNSKQWTEPKELFKNLGPYGLSRLFPAGNFDPKQEVQATEDSKSNKAPVDHGGKVYNSFSALAI